MNSKYDGVEVLLPELSKFREGDIVLTFNAAATSFKGAAISNAITKVTAGRYSHVLICSSPPTLIEAIDAGVSTLSLARCFAHSRGNIRVLRHRRSEIAAKAASFAQLDVGQSYSKRKAVSAIFPQATLASLADNGIFCSALVAQVYQLAGAVEFKSLAVAKTTPATIDNLEGLSDVTDEVFRPRLAPRNIETMSALDGDRSPTISARQTAITGRYARDLSPAVKAIIDAYPELEMGLPGGLFGIIQFIMTALDLTDEFPAEERQRFLATVIDLDHAAAELIARGELKELIDEIVAADGLDHAKLIAESFAVVPDIDVEWLKNYGMVSERQRNARATALQGFVEWGTHRAKSVAAYVDLERGMTESLEQRVTVVREVLARLS
ncbi:hypothetical protein [Neorhizobium alkalisoli]|uniref:Permuted papain-like amidase YaeF/Yiix C92 family enzyme n=1 Tax=Neorhizobium alkalisoli TaxID=528178 RepID=A0A561QCD3_9HYPH|nr:hypothetical protein [Neorhizobium alkalisoli]TWF48003.1 permuted papain-like amidase YaeF/Yiix C92 family enzyme [Neorhizobium alkalisoli]